MKWHGSVTGIALGLQYLGVFADQKPLISAGTNKGSSAAKNPLTHEFGDFVRDLLREWHVAGTAIGVIDGDDVFVPHQLPTRAKQLLVVVTPYSLC